MTNKQPFGARSTADQVLAGIDLSGRTMVVTGCTTGLGFETLSALTANGAHVFGLARDLDAARAACTAAGPFTTPIACDLADLDSVAAAAQTILGQADVIDVIVANAAVAGAPPAGDGGQAGSPFMVNHVGHAALIQALAGHVRDGAGRIVLVSDGAALAGLSSASAAATMLEDFAAGAADAAVDARQSYAVSKLANGLYALELSRRLASRGISVNVADPGATRGTRLHRHAALRQRLLRSVAGLFLRSPAQGAATQALLAGSPRAEGARGEIWRDCRSAPQPPVLSDRSLGARLWNLTQDLLSRHADGAGKLLAQAA